MSTENWNWSSSALSNNERFKMYPNLYSDSTTWWYSLNQIWILSAIKLIFILIEFVKRNPVSESVNIWAECGSLVSSVEITSLLSITFQAISDADKRIHFIQTVITSTIKCKIENDSQFISVVNATLSEEKEDEEDEGEVLNDSTMTRRRNPCRSLVHEIHQRKKKRENLRWHHRWLTVHRIIYNNNNRRHRQFVIICILNTSPRESFLLWRFLWCDTLLCAKITKREVENIK